MNLPANPEAVIVFAWRHPKPVGAAGRCVGRVDLPVDSRKARRLAYRLCELARKNQLPREVLTSPLRRCADVGRILRRWGWRHRIDPALLEVDFGNWDGRHWSAIGRDAIDAWCNDLAHRCPGGGESVVDLLRRVAAWQPGCARLLVGHGGWLSAATWLAENGAAAIGRAIDPGEWPAAPAYASSCKLVVPLAPGGHAGYGRP
ncbi:MAG: histidine phosphatase family protein [Betaproteobacteria bacterium]